MEVLLWIVIFFVYAGIKVAKISGKNSTRGIAKPNVPRKTTPARSTYKRNQVPARSFAAMPKQQKATPNVERNCNADEHHKYENNPLGNEVNRSSAVPNIPSANMHAQPKMSGNRKAARQLYIGDPVPRGTRVIRCGYCAAENLVPYNARNEYKCYFCHYDI